MFIFNLTYVKPISEVEKYLQEHIDYLEKYYGKNNFICSGRKTPRTGGIILSKFSSREEAERVMQEDPFYREGIANYDIIEFIPSKSSEEIKTILD